MRSSSARPGFPFRLAQGRWIGCALVLGFLAGTTFLTGAVPSASAQSAGVQVADNEFLPPRVGATVGATVTWTWTGSNPHTVTSTDNKFTSSPQQQGVGSTHSVQFTQPGSYPYFCQVHGSSMSGTIVITAPSPRPTSASPTPVSPRPTPAPTSARPTAAASPSRSAAPAPTSATPSPKSPTPSPALATGRSESAVPTRSAVPAETTLAVPTVLPSPTSAARSSEPLTTLDEPLPKDRSGLAIALGLAVAALGFGTAGALLLRRRRPDVV